MDNETKFRMELSVSISALNEEKNIADAVSQYT